MASMNPASPTILETATSLDLKPPPKNLTRNGQTLANSSCTFSAESCSAICLVNV
jgi:hypothetical protein